MLSTLFLIFFFVSLSRQQILSYQIHLILSILFFIFFKKVFLAFVTMQRINFHAYHPPTDKRRRRDLNPRAAINDLLPFQGSPFSHLGTSPAEFIKCIQFIELLLETEKVGFEPTAPFGVTGFQDRLLKPLGHLSVWNASVRCVIYNITEHTKCQSLNQRKREKIFIGFLSSRASISMQ